MTSLLRRKLDNANSRVSELEYMLEKQAHELESMRLKLDAASEVEEAFIDTLRKLHGRGST